MESSYIILTDKLVAGNRVLHYYEYGPDLFKKDESIFASRLFKAMEVR